MESFTKTPYWLGKHLSPEHKAKLSAARKGKKQTPQWIEMIRRVNMGNTHTLGLKMTRETRQKMGADRTGKQNNFFGCHHSEEAKSKISIAKRGRKLSLATRRAMSEGHKGNKTHLWKGGITPANKLIRSSMEYRQWRHSVFERDDYRCFDCGQRGGDLEADHIYPFAFYPRLRLMIENGITRCRPCHKQTPTFGAKARFTILPIVSINNGFIAPDGHLYEP